jgi:hypothetical protein
VTTIRAAAHEEPAAVLEGGRTGELRVLLILAWIGDVDLGDDISGHAASFDV